MLEIFTKGLVLDKENDEEDAVFTIFTESLGKIRARATSSRKILSKLASHLEPGSFSSVRLAQKNGGSNFRLIDGLREEKISLELLPEIIAVVDGLTVFGQPEPGMFGYLKRLVLAGEKPDNWKKRLLAIAGFDPEGASCDLCGSRSFAYFSSRDIMFLCERCLEKNPDCRTGLIRL
jgi:DNA repair protein RecO